MAARKKRPNPNNPSLDKVEQVPEPAIEKAIELMILDNKTPLEAAHELSLDFTYLRNELLKPYVVAYRKRMKEVLIACITPRALHRMVHLSNTATGMASVKATENILALDRDLEPNAIGQAQTAVHGPGVTIMINTINASRDSADQRQHVTIEHDQQASEPPREPDAHDAVIRARVRAMNDRGEK